MRKILLAIVALMLLPTAASADDVEVDLLRYTLNKTDLTASVVGVRRDLSDNEEYFNGGRFHFHEISIPERIKYEGIDYTVTSIGDGAFIGVEIGTVTIPNSIETIGQQAFYGYKKGEGGVSNLIMGTGVKSIGHDAFGAGSVGIKVHISDLAAWCNISHGGGYSSNPLTFGYLYMNGQEVTNLEIPYGVTNIKAYAFYFCQHITSLSIPSSVTSIERNTFANCENLTSLILPNSVTFIGESAFDHCTGLTSITIPEGVTTIGKCAFNYCIYLTSLTIPSSVTSIGQEAFSKCWRLTSVTTEIRDPFEIGPYTFYDSQYEDYIYNNVPLTVPPGTEALYKATSDWNKFKIIVEKIDDSPITIKAKDYEIKYGDPLPEKYEYTSEGGILKGEPTLTCDVSGTPNVGTYPIVVSKGTIENPNVTFVNGTLTVVSSVKIIKDPIEKIGLVYNGTAQPLIDAGEATGGTMKYCLEYNGNYSTDIPTGTDAGTYTVYHKVFVDGSQDLVYPMAITVTISPKTVANPTIILDPATFTYDGTEKKPNVTVKDGNTEIPAKEYTISYENNVEIGTAKVVIMDKEGGNYIVNGSAFFSIEKKQAVMTEAPTAIAKLVYNGQEQALISAGVVNGGTMLYSLDGNNWSRDIPTGKNANAYTVYYKVEGDDNQKGSIPVTISPKTVANPTIILDPATFIYDGTEKKPNVTVKDGNTEIPAIEYTISYENNVEAGTAKVVITDNNGGNYIVNGSAFFNIEKKSGDMTAPPTAIANLVYNGQEQALINAGVVNGGRMLYSLDGNSWSSDIPTGKNANAKNEAYTVYYKVDGDDSQKGSVSVTINPKSLKNLDVSLSQDSYIYDGNAKEPSVTVKDGDTVLREGVDYYLMYEDNIGPGTACVTVIGKGNYTDAKPIVFSIVEPAKQVAVVIAAPTELNNLVYNGQDQKLINEGKADGGTMQYSLDGINWSRDIPTGKNAGKYTVYYMVKGDDSHNDSNSGSIDVNISRKPLTISVEPRSITIMEGEDIPEFKLKYEGFVSGEGENVLTKKPTVTCDANKGSQAYDYPVTVSGAEAQNYDISYESGILTIKAVKEDDHFIEDGIDYYNLWNHQTVIIHSFNNDSKYPETQKTEGEVEIPEAVTHNGITYKVTRIGDTLLQSWGYITSITIPQYVTEIGFAAFQYCNSLNAVYINAPRLIDLPSHYGGDDVSLAFNGVDRGKCVIYVLTEELVKVYKEAPIWGEFNIVKIGSTVAPRSIEDCGMIYALTDDNTASVSGGQVEGECEIPETVTHEGVDYEVTSIEAEAFMDNTQMTQVSIPASVQSIGDDAFAGCSSLSAIYAYNTEPAVLGRPSSRTRAEGASSVFEGVDKETCLLYVPKGSVEAYRAAEGWGEFVNIIEMDATGIGGLTNDGSVFDVYGISGRKVRTAATSLDGLPKGIYIVNGKKVIK